MDRKQVATAEDRRARVVSDGTSPTRHGRVTHRAIADGATIRRVVGNALALAVAYALPRLLTLGAIVLAARVLGAERFGAYGAAGAAAVILSILSTAGMQPLLVREIAREPRAAPQLLRAAGWIKTALNALMLVVLWLLAHTAFGLSGEALQATMVLGIGYAIGSYAENLAAWFQAVERMHVWTAASAVYGAVAGLSGAALMWTTRSLPWFCAGMVIGHIAAVGWLYRAYRRDRHADPRGGMVLRSRRDAREPGRGASAPSGQGGRGAAAGGAALVRAALPFAAAFLALTVFYKADVLILSRARPGVDVGLYTAAYKLVDIAQALMLAVIVATYPRLARAAAQRSAGEDWAGTRLAELALLLVAPVAALAFLLRDPILGSLYGAQYQEAGTPAAFLMLALAPLSLNLLGGYILAAADRMKPMAMLYGGAALVKLTAVAILAPRWGGSGVAAAMLGSELLLGAGFMIVLRRTVHAAPGRRALAGVLAVAAACAIVSSLPDPSGGSVRAALLLVLVGVVYARLDVVTKAEHAALRAACRLREQAHQPGSEAVSPSQHGRVM